MQKPSSVVSAPQFAVELVGAKASLAGCSQMERSGPLNSFACDRSITVPVITVKSLRHSFFSPQRYLPGFFGCVVLHAPASRANWTIRPPGGLKPLPGSGFIGKWGSANWLRAIGKVSLCPRLLAFAACGVNCVMLVLRVGLKSRFLREIANAGTGGPCETHLSAPEA